MSISISRSESILCSSRECDVKMIALCYLVVLFVCSAMGNSYGGMDGYPDSPAEEGKEVVGDDEEKCLPDR